VQAAERGYRGVAMTKTVIKGRLWGLMTGMAVMGPGDEHFTPLYIMAVISALLTDLVRGCSTRRSSSTSPRAALSPNHP
jgi:hypothetical protein